MLAWPFSSLWGGFPVLKNPNRKKAITLTLDEFTFGFANAVPAAEAEQLYDEYRVACSGIPLPQVATANLNPRTEARVEIAQDDRGPLLVVSGEKDRLVPWSVDNALYKQWRKHAGGTPAEIVEMPGRAQSLIVDAGWEEVADTALAFLERYDVTP